MIVIAKRPLSAALLGVAVAWVAATCWAQADPDPCPNPLDCTDLPSSFTMGFSGLAFTGLPLAEELKETDADPMDSGDACAEECAPFAYTGSGSFYYNFPTPETGEESNGMMRTSFTPCIPLPCVPAIFGEDDRNCDYYLGRYSLDGGAPDSSEPYRVVLVDPDSGRWTLAYENFGPVYPDMISRYAATNAFPIQEALPLGIGIFRNPHLPTLWYPAAGVGGRYETTDWVGMVADPEEYLQVDGAYHRPLYTFGGKHGQAVYHWRTIDLDPVDPSVFELPELTDANRVDCGPAGSATACSCDGETCSEDACPDTYAFDSVDQPAPGSCEEGEDPADCGVTPVMVCVACHVSEPPDESDSE